jgi:hypothetical protein
LALIWELLTIGVNVVWVWLVWKVNLIDLLYHKNCSGFKQQSIVKQKDKEPKLKREQPERTLPVPLEVISLLQYPELPNSEEVPSSSPFILLTLYHGTGAYSTVKSVPLVIGAVTRSILGASPCFYFDHGLVERGEGIGIFKVRCSESFRGLLSVGWGATLVVRLGFDGIV